MSTGFALSTHRIYDADTSATEGRSANLYLEFVQYRRESLVELDAASAIACGDAPQTTDPF